MIDGGSAVQWWEVNNPNAALIDKQIILCIKIKIAFGHIPYHCYYAYFEHNN